jgi:hypothetical protein
MLRTIVNNNCEGCYTGVRSLDHMNKAGLQFAHVGRPLGHAVNCWHEEAMMPSCGCVAQQTFPHTLFVDKIHRCCEVLLGGHCSCAFLV